MDLLVTFAGMVLIPLSLLRPHLGLIGAMSMIPLVESLPNVPLATSLVSLLGMAAMAGTVMHVVVQGKMPAFSGLLAFGALLVIWMTASNPYAAMVGGARNWTFTFVQLLALTWMAGYLLPSAKRQKYLMLAFAVATVISTFFIFSGTVLAATRAESVRSAGLAGGTNNASRYIVLSIIFLVYLRSVERRSTYRMVLLGGIGILLAGLAYTLSRSGILLLLFAGLLLGFRLMGGSSMKTSTKFQVVVSVGIVAGVIILLLPDSIFQAYSSVLHTADPNRFRPDMESIDQNARIFLALAGYEMWLDHPIQGVGIGQFPGLLQSYSIFFREEIGPHNMYLNMLAETGIVGLVIFLTLIGTAARRLYRASRRPGATLNLPYIWFVCLMVLAVGGLLKHDHANKLLWLFIGMSIPFGDAAPKSRRGKRGMPTKSKSKSRRPRQGRTETDPSVKGTREPGSPEGTSESGPADANRSQRGDGDGAPPE